MATRSSSPPRGAAALTPLERPIPDVDARLLAAELSRRTRAEVRFSAGSRALYANDASVYRQMPIGVVVPRSIDDVVAAVAICREHGAPILARGCGTGLAGQSVNAGVILDFSKHLHQIVELDPERRVARVQPGVVLDVLRARAEEHGLTFGPDPATHTRCTLGGMIGNNSCGVHSILAGVTADNIEALDVLLYDGTRLTVGKTSERELERIIADGGRRGEIYAALRDLRDRYAELIRERFPAIPRRISGFNLDRLLPEHGFDVAAALVGTESTCGLTLEATCRLIPSPQHRALVLLGYDSADVAADQVPRMMEFDPIGLETFDQRLVDNELHKGFPRHTELLPEGGAWLLVEFGAMTPEEAAEQAERLCGAMRKDGGPHRSVKLYEDEREVAQVWEIREGGVGHSKVPGVHPGWPSWEDAAVPPERTGDYLRDLEALCDEHGLRISCVFGHVGHGCLHTRIDFDFSTAEGVRTYRRFLEDAADLVAGYGGSLSGEHGDGQARGELLDRMFGSELVRAFREFKAIWDPDRRMNPGKAADAAPLDEDLRFDPGYRPLELKTHFAFPQDGFSFTAATERCFGVGVCRELEAGEAVMCPSFRATREEAHSTRGRARLLWEMVRATDLTHRWREAAVKESLDLCLACKGCKSDCPVRVDMATYKAEFLSHYYKRRPRPAPAYALGLVYWAAQAGSRAPRLVNALMHAEPSARAVKRIAGIAPEREIPAFAGQDFRRRFAARHGTPSHGPRVLVWPDTFTTYFEPEVGLAAVEVLQAAGRSVAIPGRPLCCGRPLYDFGMLTLARRQLRQILRELRADIRSGTPLIGLEPSCVAVFRDELPNLMPHDEDAGRLAKQTFTLGEYLESIDWAPPPLHGRALVQAHCHHRSVLRFDADRSLLDGLGLQTTVLESGCCGMAGSFGYERGEKYDVSMRCGEDVILPAVRAANADTMVIADGFSCRSQIRHGTTREPLHSAQVLREAVRRGGRDAR
jgi:FAD/FMN-containing dehydrogenase/Fe-S oxidoreductase